MKYSFQKIASLGLLVFSLLFVGLWNVDVYHADDGIEPAYCDGCGGTSYPFNASQDVYDYPPEYGTMYLVFHSAVTVRSSSSISVRSQTYTSNMLPTISYGVSGTTHYCVYSAMAPDWTYIQNRWVSAYY